MKNNTFDLTRFGQLVKKDISENWKTNLYMWLSIFAGLLIICLVSYYDYKDHGRLVDEKQYLFFASFIFVIAGIRSGSSMMNAMSSKSKRINYLMNPASTFEKFVCRWFMTVIAQIIIFSLVFLLADCIKVVAYSLYFPSAEVTYFHLKKIIVSTDGAKLLALFLFVQSIYMLGSTFWQKNSYLKTTSALTIGLIVFAILFITLGHFLFTNGIGGFAETLHNLSYAAEQQRANTILIILLLIGTPINWGLTLLRLNESEIN